MSQSRKPSDSIVPDRSHSSYLNGSTSAPHYLGDGEEHVAEQILTRGATDILLERVNTWKHEEAIRQSVQLYDTGRSAVIGTFDEWSDDCKQKEDGDKKIYAVQVSREFGADMTDVVGKIAMGGARINAEIASRPISYERETQKKGFWDSLFKG